MSEPLALGACVCSCNHYRGDQFYAGRISIPSRLITWIYPCDSDPATICPISSKLELVLYTHRTRESYLHWAPFFRTVVGPLLMYFGSRIMTIYSYHNVQRCIRWRSGPFLPVLQAFGDSHTVSSQWCDSAHRYQFNVWDVISTAWLACNHNHVIAISTTA